MASGRIKLIPIQLKPWKNMQAVRMKTGGKYFVVIDFIPRRRLHPLRVANRRVQFIPVNFIPRKRLNSFGMTKCCIYVLHKHPSSGIVITTNRLSLQYLHYISINIKGLRKFIPYLKGIFVFVLLRLLCVLVGPRLVLCCRYTSNCIATEGRSFIVSECSAAGLSEITLAFVAFKPGSDRDTFFKLFS